MLAEVTEYSLLPRYRSRSTEWSAEEDAILQELYPQAPRSDLLMALPSRSWVAIRGRAKANGVSRFTYAVGELHMPDTLALEDWAILQECGVEPGKWVSGPEIIPNDTVRCGVIALMIIKLPLDISSFGLYNQR